MADRPFGFGLPDKPEDQGGQALRVPAGLRIPGRAGPRGRGRSGRWATRSSSPTRCASSPTCCPGRAARSTGTGQERRPARIAAAGDPSVLEAQRPEITEAVRLADLWLDEATSFPSGIRKIEAWSRSEWLEATFPVWAKLCDPIAAKGVEAMRGMLTTDPAQLGEGVPEELRQALGAFGGGAGGLGGLAGLAAMMRQIGGAMIGSQTGTAIGTLAGEVIGSSDIGLPLGPAGVAALLPAGIAEFGQGLSVDADEVRLFLAPREAAHQRLFAHVPWLRAHLLARSRSTRAASRSTRRRRRVRWSIPRS